MASDECFPSSFGLWRSRDGTGRADGWPPMMLGNGTLFRIRYPVNPNVFRRTSGNLQYPDRLPSASLKVDDRSSRRNERISRQAEGQNRSHVVGRSQGAWHEASVVSRQLRLAAPGSPRPGRPGNPAKWTVITLMVLAGLAVIASMIH